MGENRLKIVYFGSGAFGLPTLKALTEQHTVTCVVTQPDRPAGRGAQLTPTPIGEFAQTHLAGVPLIKPEKVGVPAVVDQIRAVEADAWVVIAFGQKLSRALLEGRFAINLHASLLPRWRGAAPINAAILAGDDTTGNSVITLADRMDAGLILGTSTRAIEPLMTAGELHDLLSADGPELVLRVLDEYSRDALKPVTQDETGVTIATKLSRGDASVNFGQRADFVRRVVHALTPWPGINVEIRSSGSSPNDDGVPVKLLRVQPVPGSHQEDPGTITDSAQGLVACGHHTLVKVLEVQPPGKRAMSWTAFANGRSIPTGSRMDAPGPSDRPPRG